MGQGASHAESSIQRALLCLLREAADNEEEQLRCCGLDDSSIAVLAETATHPLDGTASDSVNGLPPSTIAMRESFGPLTNVTPAFYTIDEIRAALPLLPDTLWVSLHRITVLYLLDADGDGRVSRSDVARFTDWAIENVPESVPSEQLAEALHAHAALHCWQRCLAHAAAEEEESVRTGRTNGRPWSTAASATAATAAAAASSSSSSQPTPSAAASPPRLGSPPCPRPTGTEATPLPATGSSNTLYTSPRPNPCAAATASASALMDSAALHFSHWVVLFVAQQEAERRRRHLLAVQRARLVRRAQARTATTTETTTIPAATSVSTRINACTQHSPSPTAPAEVPSALPPPPLTAQQVALWEMQEDAVDALVQDTPTRWSELEKAELFTASGVEEVYLDLGVLESLGLSFWGFCRLLDAAAAAAVESALGLSSEQADHEISCASVLEDLRRLLASRQLESRLSQSRRTSRTSSPDTSGSRGARANGRVTPQRRRDHSPNGSEDPDRVAAAAHIPDFTVSRFVLQASVFCFVHSNWELLQSIGFDPLLVGGGNTL